MHFFVSTLLRFEHQTRPRELKVFLYFKCSRWLTDVMMPHYNPNFAIYMILFSVWGQSSFVSVCCRH